jgi:hypothetical protein
LGFLTGFSGLTGFEMTDSELKSKCFTILAEQVGSVEMERFVMLLNRDTFDYTEWRKNNLFQNETVDSLCDQIEQFQQTRENRVTS